MIDNIMSIHKILYVGADLHLDPLQDFPDCKEFIMIDSSPRNEYGYSYYDRSLYRKNFYDELHAQFEKLEYQKIKEEALTHQYEEIMVPHLDSTCLTFVKGDRTVKYYISTGIPTNLYTNKKLQDDIATASTLLISGYYPHCDILDYMVKPITIIGYSKTYYPRTIEQLNTVTNHLCIFHSILEHPQIVSSYLFVNGNDQIHCVTYDEFYEAYKNKNKY